MAFICPKEPGCAAFHHRMHRDKAQVQKKKERGKTDPKFLIVCFQGNCSNQFSPPGTIMGLNQKKKKVLLQKIQQSILKSDLVSLNATSQLRWRDALSSVGKILQASSPGKCNIHYCYFPLGMKRSATPALHYIQELCVQGWGACSPPTSARNEAKACFLASLTASWKYCSNRWILHTVNIHIQCFLHGFKRNQ